MNSIEKHIESIEFQDKGYKPLVDYDKWRVAVLKYCEDLKIENITFMQKHDETDEVFVLLAGNCTLYCGGNGEKPDNIEAVKMEPFKIYNVKKGVWHNHTMDEPGQVLIVENQNTCEDNSPRAPLSDEQISYLRTL